MRKFLFLLLLLSFVGTLSANTIVVRGKVTDASTKEAVIGATVAVEGTTIATMTDIDGVYAIEVPTESHLEVSYLGYKTALIPVEARPTIDIQMQADVTAIEEVVVVGYGGQKRSSLSTSIATMKIAEDVKSQPTSLFSALQGQIPGVTIRKNGGDPMNGLSIAIRGQGSRSGDPVLFVVDGVPGAPYNEQDVESVTVLKDAAAAAIYGANVGSGGVILITTRQAKAGKAVITAKVQTGMQQVYKLPEMMTAEQYNMVRTDAAKVSGKPTPAGCDPNIYPWGNVTRTDWLDEIFRTGTMQNYAISISGGNEKLRGMTSFEYNKVEGTLLNTHSQDFGIVVAVDYNPYKWLTFSQRVSYKYSNGQGGVSNSSHTGVIASAMFYPRSATVYEMDKEGNYVLDANGNRTFGGTVPVWAKDLGVAGTFGEVQNPVASLFRLNQDRPSNTIYSTSSFLIKPIEHLSIKSDISLNGYFNRYESFSPRKPEIGKPDYNNSRTIDNSMGYGYLWETVATYERYLGKHHLSAMAGMSFKYNQARGNGTTLKGFPNENPNDQHFSNGTNWSDEKPWESFGEEATTGFFARGSYSFDDRYFVVASVRRDASSKLYSDNNSGVFPAFSAAWKVSSEQFMKQQDVISMLKLRGSWGVVGNVNSVGNYSYVSSLVQSGGIYLGNQGQTFINGLGLATIPNLGLKWESSEQMDIGVDIGLFRGKLNIAADYYIKNTRDLIEQLPVPSVAGLMTAPYANIGLVENSGWEFTATYSDQTRGGFSYSISANAAIQKNTVKDLGSRDFFPHNDGVRGLITMRSTVGQSWYSYYLIESDGIFQNQQEINDYQKDGVKIQPNARPGDLKYVDRNGDGLINDEDRSYMDSYMPKLTYGLSANFAYKGFDLSFQIQGVSGNKIFNGSKVMTYAPGQGWNLSSDLLNAWNYNKESNIPLVSMSDENGNFSTASDFFLEDGSYCRLKNVTFGYTLPSRWFGKENTTKARIFFSGENLLTITNYSGMDPEVGGNGIDGGTYPVSRIFSLGINITL